MERPARRQLARFVDWAENHNGIALEAAATVGAWFWVTLFGAGLALLVGAVPYVKDFFGLRLVPALCVLLFVWGASTVGILSTRRRSTVTRGVGTLVGNALAMLYPASLVALSNARGAAVFALLPVFVAAYHGHFHRTGVRYPYGVLSTSLGMLGAVAIDPTHAALFAVIGPLAVALNLTLGTFALRGDALVAERERLRAAVDAQALRDRALEVQKLGSALLDVLGANHDVGNALMSAKLNVEWIHQACAKGDVALDREELDRVGRELGGSLEQLLRILQESRRLGRETMGEAAALREVALAANLERVRGAVSRRYPASIRVNAARDAWVLVRGGDAMLERMLENVLLNACEGDGRQGATTIDVAVHEREGFVTIDTIDDGPGFSDRALETGIAAFATTKTAGSGLGLYTVERLAVASGGRLERANRPAGGASVRIVLAKGSKP